MSKKLIQMAAVHISGAIFKASYLVAKTHFVKYVQAVVPIGNAEYDLNILIDYGFYKLITYRTVLTVYQQDHICLLHCFSFSLTISPALIYFSKKECAQCKFCFGVSLFTFYNPAMQRMHTVYL